MRQSNSQNGKEKCLLLVVCCLLLVIVVACWLDLRGKGCSNMRVRTCVCVCVCVCQPTNGDLVSKHCMGQPHPNH